MTKPPTIKRIRASVAFRNITEAMNQVFGDGWRLSTIWPAEHQPDDTANDFTAAVDIWGRAGAAYLNAVNTHIDGYYAFGPGGMVGIAVPTPRTYVSIAPDGVWINDVEMAGGIPFPEMRWASGADGDKVDLIVKYLQILKSYLETHLETHLEPSASRPAPRWTKIGSPLRGSPRSYEQIAHQAGATYFDMGDAWKALKAKLPSSWTSGQIEDEMWRFNQQFLDNQMAAGKAFVFTSNPFAYPPKSVNWREFQHLLANGYHAQFVHGVWRMIK